MVLNSSAIFLTANSWAWFCIFTPFVVVLIFSAVAVTIGALALMFALVTCKLPALVLSVTPKEVAWFIRAAPKVVSPSIPDWVVGLNADTKVAKAPDLEFLCPSNTDSVFFKL